MARKALLGWRNSSPQAALAFFAPEPLSAQDAVLFTGLTGSSGSAASLARRMFVLRSPSNLRIRMTRGTGQPPQFVQMPEAAGLSEQAFRGLVTPILPEAQRNPETPACQLALNMIFVTDEPCMLQIMPPFHWSGFRQWPGSIVCGRFPLRAWPRPLNCVLEWQEPDRDWVIRRGDPLATVLILYPGQEIDPELVEAALIPDLKRHFERIDSVSDMGRNVGPMFAEAERRRPKQLLKPKQLAT